MLCEKPSLWSRRLELVGTGKNWRARRRHAREEGAPAQNVPENRFPPPLQLPGSRCVICQTFWQKTIDLAQAKRAAKTRSLVHFIFGLKYICYKDQLGYLIIERWSNKLMVNTQLSSSSSSSSSFYYPFFYSKFYRIQQIDRRGDLKKPPGL